MVDFTSKSAKALYYEVVAGTSAGMIEYGMFFAVDAMRLHTKYLKSDLVYSKISKKFQGPAIVTNISRTFMGMALPIASMLPAHALYSYTYKNTQDTVTDCLDAKCTFIAQFAACTFATINFDIIRNPAEVVKQRMQVYDNPYNSSFHCLKSIARNEGLSALYRSLNAQLATDIPYSTICFITYDICQRYSNPKQEWNLKSYMLSGFVAGATAAAVTNPLDVGRALLNMQETSTLGVLEENRIQSLLQALKVVHKTHGIKGFLRGLGIRVISSALCVSAFWSSFETFRHYFSKKEEKRQ
ncbi:mitoferrin-1 [Trichonephila clavipes]|nr:mitoferrin-1 [Trichonephila clavipes]